MSAPAAPAEPIIRRGEQFGRLLPVPTLMAATLLSGISAATGLTSVGRFWFGAAVSLVAAVWSLVVVRPSNRRGTRWRAVSWGGQFGFAAVLVEANGWYGIYAFCGYLVADLLPRQARRPVMTLNALVVAAAQIGGYPDTAGAVGLYIGVAAVNVGLVAVFVTLSDRVIEQNERLGAALAENAGLHEQLVAQAREAGVLDERQRLAGEIHDTLAQGLVGIVTQLEAAEQARHLPEQSQRHLSQARELARANLVDARRSVQALRPEQLERSDLGAALAELASRWQDDARLTVDTTGSAQALPTDVEDVLFRVAQEALSNVAKHAVATKVAVTLTYLDDLVLLDVRDDGRGVDPDATHDGFGLTGMRQRLDRVGGRLEVESAPGEGLALSAAVPL